MPRPFPILLTCASALLVSAAALPMGAVASQAGVTPKGELRIGGFGGERNEIEVSFKPGPASADGVVVGDLVVTDTAGVVAAGAQCIQRGIDRVRCEGATITKISAVLGDGDDVFEVRTAGVQGVPARIATLTRGGGGDDVIRTGGGPDRAFGESGRDTLAGGDGNDRLDGGTGADGVIGEYGADRLLGGAGPDAIFGGKGRDRLVGGDGVDTLLARDKKRDRLISCGLGNDRRESAIRDRRDPKPRSC